MNKLKQWFADGQHRFAELSLRERWLALGATWALIAWLGLVLYENSAESKVDQLKQTQQSLTAQLEQQQIIKNELSQGITKITNNGEAQRIARLTQRLNKLNESVDQRMQTLVEPSQMSSLLLAMLEGSSGLTLLELSNEAPKPLNVEEGSEPLYRHDLSLLLSGSYLALLEYVEQIELLSGRIFWRGIEFEIETHPDASIRLNFFTVSQHKELLRG